jgi:hypothetical protein
MNRNKVRPNARGTKIRAKKLNIKAEDLIKCYQDLLLRERGQSGFIGGGIDYE